LPQALDSFLFNLAVAENIMMLWRPCPHTNRHQQLLYVIEVLQCWQLQAVRWCVCCQVATFLQDLLWAVNRYSAQEISHYRSERFITIMNTAYCLGLSWT
jgi:hypothetical protein